MIERRKNMNEKIKELKDYKKALYIIDMVEGFVNIGAMANPEYNKLVPEQLKIINEFRKNNELVNFICEGHNENALEFNTYPKHCVKGTKEAELIPELKPQIELPNTKIYQKNSINGMLNDQLRSDILKMENLEETIFVGVCEDLCVMDFARTYARYMDEINHKTKLYVIGNAVDTFDGPNHNREEWKKIARMVMEQAGITYLNNFEELKEKTLCLK